MASSILLLVKPRGKPIKSLPKQLSLQPSDTTEDLHQQLAETSGFSIHRLRVTLGGDGSLVVPNSAELTVAGAGLEDHTRLFVKDLGPQISWRTVYVIEYLGPLFIHPLLYRLRLAQPTPAQTLTLYIVLLHFIKREVETIFVHRFSNATMPVRNVFKNSFHYWILSGALLAWFVYSPSAALPSHPSSPSPSLKALFSSLPFTAYLGLGLFALGSAFNARVHLIQRALRRPGTVDRGIPAGPGFAWVTCPNYMFETVTWVGVLLVSRSWATALFIVVAVAQMKAWADKKEARYRREFGDKYRAKRYTVLPGIC